MKASRVFYCEGMPKVWSVIPVVWITLRRCLIIWRRSSLLSSLESLVCGKSFLPLSMHRFRAWDPIFLPCSFRLNSKATSLFFLSFTKRELGRLSGSNGAALQFLVRLLFLRYSKTSFSNVFSKILDFFEPLGITIREVYGMSEVTGPTSFNTEERTKLGTVGPVFPGVEVKIVEDGEIVGLCRFLTLPDVSSERAKRIFWLLQKPSSHRWSFERRMALLGRFGRLWRRRIHAHHRQKERYHYHQAREISSFPDKSPSGGKNITPINIENAVKTHPLIGECVVVGDARHFLTALISIDLDVRIALNKF